jgi:hypothetical protein
MDQPLTTTGVVLLVLPAAICMLFHVSKEAIVPRIRLRTPLCYDSLAANGNSANTTTAGDTIVKETSSFHTLRQAFSPTSSLHLMLQARTFLWRH